MMSRFHLGPDETDTNCARGPGRFAVEASNHRHRRLLPARRERPRRRDGKTTDEISMSEWTEQHLCSTLPIGVITTVSPKSVPVLDSPEIF
jgi:hypothetical protein